MSFDLTFFRCENGASPLDEYARLIETDLESRAPLSALEAARLRSLILEAHPPFAKAQTQFSEGSFLQFIDEELGLSVGADSILIELNLRYFQSNSEAAFHAVSKIGQALASANFHCFDSQSGELVDWALGTQTMRKRFDALPQQLANARILDLGAPPPKPWWKFW